MTTKAPVARAEMLIRKPIAEVFEAFVEPTVTSNFWFTKGSGRLETGRRVTWEWEMYNFSAQVEVKAVDPDKRILVEWSADGTPTLIEWVFTPRGEDQTFVSITNSGFTGDAETVVRKAIDSTEGFALVLAGLKAFLEHGVHLNLVLDRHPPALG